MSEFPLVLFTFFSQLSVGTFLALYLSERRGGISPASARLASHAAFGAVAISMVCSTMHLGDPAGAWRAMLNPWTSWLSREILVFGVFAGLSFLYCMPMVRGTLRQLVGLLGSFLGIVGIVCSGLIYTLPSHPAWDTPFPVLFFLLTAWLLGPMLLLCITRRDEATDSGQCTGCVKILLAAQLVITCAYLLTQQAWLDTNSTLAAVRILVGILMPFVFLRGTSPSWGGAFLLCACGELLGRVMFYDNVIPYTMFGM